MQDRIEIKKIVRGVVKGAVAVKDALNVDWVFEQAKAQIKRQQEKKKEREKNRNRR